LVLVVTQEKDISLSDVSMRGKKRLVFKAVRGVKLNWEAHAWKMNN